MASLLNEIQAMQNPALGAALIWRFACGYCPEGHDARGTPLPLAFVVLPILLHAHTREHVMSTRAASGLRLFELKFAEEGDYLLAIRDRMLALRSLSLRSLREGLAAGLLTLVPNDGTFWPRSRTAPRDVETETAELMKAAERLGLWCAEVTLFEVERALRVEF